ncbi:hypothetical protein EJ02DRAFT_508559 [Clathrospora elynae]|uniref:Uncharacterized protein n=1 Tax=Clathrospora elynae TaxID=706981 RepID=A0A6A5T3F0_9PLEO|nr:hypothetical protein EJ02DRAFT_508559 [Clathrospora elynae]
MRVNVEQSGLAAHTNLLDSWMPPTRRLVGGDVSLDVLPRIRSVGTSFSALRVARLHTVDPSKVERATTTLLPSHSPPVPLFPFTLFRPLRPPEVARSFHVPPHLLFYNNLLDRYSCNIYRPHYKTSNTIGIMGMPNIFTMLMLFLLVTIVAASPMAAVTLSSSAAQCECDATCNSQFKYCVGHRVDRDFCSNLVCSANGLKCEACLACQPGASYPYDFTRNFTAAANSTTVVKREQAQEKDAQECFYICRHAGCERLCYDKDATQADEANGALVISEANMNGTMAVTLSSNSKCKQ